MKLFFSYDISPQCSYIFDIERLFMLYYQCQLVVLSGKVFFTQRDPYLIIIIIKVSLHLPFVTNIIVKVITLKLNVKFV